MDNDNQPIGIAKRAIIVGEPIIFTVMENGDVVSDAIELNEHGRKLIIEKLIETKLENGNEKKYWVELNRKRVLCRE